MSFLNSLYSEISTEPPFLRSLLAHAQSASVSIAHEQLFPPLGEKAPFHPLFKNFGEKSAFQKGDFTAIFLPMVKESASGHRTCIVPYIVWLNGST